MDGASGLMAREDVARAILNTLDDDERYAGKCVAIGVEATEEEDMAAMSRLRAHYKSIQGVTMMVAFFLSYTLPSSA